MNKVELEKIKRAIKKSQSNCKRLEVENEEVKFNRQLLRFLAIAMEV